jgi:hypothetical protein
MPNGQFKICSAMQAFDYSHHGRYELAVSDMIISEMAEAEPQVTWLLYPEYETTVSSRNVVLLRYRKAILLPNSVVSEVVK